MTSVDTEADATAGWAFETKQVHAGQTPDVAASPFNGFLVALGLEALNPRVERHVANAQRVAVSASPHPAEASR